VGTEPAAAPDDEDDVDPRRTRSRTRLLDAAANLLKTGGIEAVTIDAVTKPRSTDVSAGRRVSE
jgi:AcrR family transcriptional regulator